MSMISKLGILWGTYPHDVDLVMKGYGYQTIGKIYGAYGLHFRGKFFGLLVGSPTTIVTPQGNNKRELDKWDKLNQKLNPPISSIENF